VSKTALHSYSEVMLALQAFLGLVWIFYLQCLHFAVVNFIIVDISMCEYKKLFCLLYVQKTRTVDNYHYLDEN